MGVMQQTPLPEVMQLFPSSEAPVKSMKTPRPPDMQVEAADVRSTLPASPQLKVERQLVEPKLRAVLSALAADTAKRIARRAKATVRVKRIGAPYERIARTWTKARDKL
jgi:transglutaminase-like putative cysteine protease